MCTAVDLEGAQVATTRWRGWVGSGVWCAPHGRGIRPEVIVVVLETDGETHVLRPGGARAPRRSGESPPSMISNSRSLVSSTRLSCTSGSREFCDCPHCAPGVAAEGTTRPRCARPRSRLNSDTNVGMASTRAMAPATPAGARVVNDAGLRIESQTTSRSGRVAATRAASSSVSRRRMKLVASPTVAPAISAPSMTTRRFHPVPASMLDDPIEARPPVGSSPNLLNDDLAPVALPDRTFTTYDIAALWIGLVVCVPAYTLAGSVIDLGMSAFQGIACIAIANLIVLLPMVLNGHAGCKYGVPFPVLARSAFGIKGANVPAVMRALVGCGWFGIQTHVGGQAIFAIACAAAKLSTVAMAASHFIPALGISSYELACYGVFWAAQMAVVVKGIESIRVVEKYAAPVLIILCVSLFVWAYIAVSFFLFLHGRLD